MPAPPETGVILLLLVCGRDALTFPETGAATIFQEQISHSKWDEANMQLCHGHPSTDIHPRTMKHPEFRCRRRPKGTHARTPRKPSLHPKTNSIYPPRTHHPPKSTPLVPLELRISHECMLSLEDDLPGLRSAPRHV